MIRFVADIGSNHNQTFDRAIALINACKRTGSQAAKFQLFRAEKLYRDPAKWPEIRVRELPKEWIPKLSEHAHSLGLQFGVTPFDLESLAFCVLYCDFIKISSFDILRDDLIDVALRLSKELILSCGLIDSDDINSYGRPIEQLYCISKYPSEITDINFLEYVCGKYHGYSDHTAAPLAIEIMAGLKREAIIEYHLDLDDLQGMETKHGHVWNETKITETIATVRHLEAIHYETYKPDLSQRADPKDGLRPIREV